METKEKLALLEEIMDLDEGELELEMNLEEIDEWDSLSKLSLIATSKTRFGKVLSSADIEKFKKVKDICDFLG